jgi:hypothetical protein
LVLGANGFVWDHRFQFVDAATTHGLPTMAEDPAMVREASALVAYSYLQAEEDRVRADNINRILRGANLPTFLSNSPRSSS